MPVAKLEPAKAHRDEDNRIARIAWSEAGLGWLVHDDVFATRREVADEFIAVFRAFDAFPHLKGWGIDVPGDAGTDDTAR